MKTSDVEVKLNPPGAIITMSKYIDASQLQAQLSIAGYYSIKEIRVKQIATMILLNFRFLQTTQLMH